MKFAITMLAVLSCLSLSARAEPVLYKIDSAHTVASFRVKHLGLTNVNGAVTGVQGTLLLDEESPATGKLEVTLDVTTIDTGVDKRDEHLRSADFFDTAKFPTMTFKSTRIERSASGWTVTGDLTIKDVTKPVVLEVEAATKPITNPAGAVVRGTSATTKLSRKAFGLTWNKLVEGVDLVGDDIKLVLDVELIRAVQQPAQPAR